VPGYSVRVDGVCVQLEGIRKEILGEKCVSVEGLTIGVRGKT
jgi:hypothetical protein